MNKILLPGLGVLLGVTFLFAPVLGRGWQWQNPLPFGDPITQVFFVDDQHGWMNPKNRTLLRTNDGGDNWEILRIGIFFDDIHFVDPLEGWGIGRQEFVPETRNSIYHTTDGGLTWEIQLADITVEYDIFFVDRLHGWATGTGSKPLFHTDNGGESWDIQAEGAFRIGTDIVRGVTFLDSLKGWAVGGLLWGIHTRDGGKTWARDSTLSARQKIVYTDSLHLWALSRGHLGSCTIDGGKTWEEFTITDTTLEVFSHDIFALDSSRVFVATNIGIFASSDGGQTWVTQRTTTYEGWWEVAFVDTTHGWAIGYDPQLDAGIIHTEDGGNTGTALSREIFFSDIVFVDTQYGWGVGGNGKILHTRDGGQSWTRQPSYAGKALKDVDFVDRFTGWAVGWQGAILHTKTGGVTSVSERFSEPALKKNFILYNNYPNPFNPETRIRFDIVKSRAAIRLMIFDLLGREIAVLFKGERPAGTYEFVWDGTNKDGREVASGIYFYRLQIGNHAIETKKMLLLR